MKKIIIGLLLNMVLSNFVLAEKTMPNQWGAIAFDAKVASIGAVNGNKISAAAAEKEALDNCIKSGGTQRGCMLVSEWQNHSCGAIAVDDTSVVGKVFFKAVKSEKTRLEAERSALAACSQEAKACQVYFSGCGQDEPK